MDNDFLAKVFAGIAALGAALYGTFRMLKNDQRGDAKADMTDGAMTQVIMTLREEVARLSERLEKVEAQNKLCEEMNMEMRIEITRFRAQLAI